MGKVATSATLPVSQEASNYDEVFMQQSLLFDDSLKDLKNLRAQLYSAAEYFELSYSNDDQKQIVVETLKDYAIKALVNTVDHLGSVTYKVNDLLDEKVVEVSVAELRVSCIEQFLLLLKSMFMMLNDHIFAFLKFISSVGETMHGANRTKSKYVGYNLDDEAVRATIRETPPSTARRGRSPSPSLQPQSSGAFSFTSTMPKKDLERRSVSPYRFPLLRTGSRSSRPPTPKISRPTTPNPSRPTTPNPSNARQRYPSEPRKSSSMRLSAERDHGKDIEQYPSKSKRLLKALLSRRKSKKDDMLYTYLDEY
ncbi:Protein ABIL2 [Glycine max]|nr:Protein ABIL2 [Glycine max]